MLIELDNRFDAFVKMIQSILMGFGLGEDAIHSPNENYRLDHFYKGIETIIQFYQHFAAASLV